jgi:hypothetical protein
MSGVVCGMSATDQQKSSIVWDVSLHLDVTISVASVSTRMGFVLVLGGWRRQQAGVEGMMKAGSAGRRNY